MVVRTRLVLLGLGLWSLAACQPNAAAPSVPPPAAGAAGGHEAHPGPPPAPADAAAVRPGTAAMARRLAALSASIPFEEDLYSSERRLAEMLQLPMPADSSAQFQLRSQIAIEQLNAGQPEAAAASFGQLRTFLLDIGHDLSSSAALREVTSREAIAWLRFGEVQNCAVHHNADSCLLPIQGGGVHQDRRGVDHAIPLLETLLRSDPNDLTNRWVLNVAHMAAGTWPDGVREAWRIPPEQFASTGSLPRFTDVAVAAGLAPMDQAGGAIVDDFTGDGHLDVVVSSMGLHDPLRFFASRGDGTFEDRTAAAGLTGLTGGLNLVQGDYDGDGWLDFLVLRGGWFQTRQPIPSSLVRNLGGGVFEDVTQASGLVNEHPTQAGAFGDYDNDGDLDVFIGNESLPSGPARPSVLFRNEGDGTFREVGSEAGVATPGFAKAAVWGDYDNDGRIDLYVSRQQAVNLLYHNEGPGADGVWRFREVAAAAGVSEPIQSFPTWWFDYDNDGWLDLAVSGYGNLNSTATPNSSAAANVAADVLGLPTDADRFHLYRNRGDGTFEDVSAAAGVDAVLYTMGANVGDLDNDGHEDFYAGTGNPDFRTLVPNRMFRNTGRGTFEDVTTAGGFGHLQKGHGVSFADIDNDGDQDVYEDLGGAFDGDTYPNILFENPGHDGRHWVTLRLQGPGFNRSAIGARVAVRAAGPDGAERTLHRVVGSGGSFGGNSLQVEVGLGTATTLTSVEVRWPGQAEAEVFEGVGVDGIWRIEAGTGRASAVVQQAFRLGGGALATR